MTDTVYFWRDESGAWQLARKTIVSPKFVQGKDGFYDPWFLVQHLYSHRLEWVPESNLSVYYGDNKTEGAKCKST